MKSGRPLNPAIGYNRFAEIVRDAELSVNLWAPALLGYSRDAVARRLLQRIVELGLTPFLQECAARHQRGEAAMPAAGESFNAGGLRFETSAPRVATTARLWTRSLLEFAGQWLRVFVIVARSALRKPNKEVCSAALLFGVGIDDIRLSGSDRRFLEFCRRGPIGPLRNARRLVVECLTPAISEDSSYCTYAKYPLFELASDHPPRGLDLIRFAWKHCETAVRFIAACLGEPLTAILARDMAFHSLISYLDRIGAIDSVIITNSHYHVQPLWMRSLQARRFTSHMVWYSQNSIPFTYRSDGIRSYLPNHRYIEVDDVWVWTVGFRDYLVAQGAKGRVHAVGPILWYLPDPVPQESARDAILVFDVTPMVPGLVHKLGLTYNYYRAENVRAFVADILAARDLAAAEVGRRLPVLLKHKRSPSEYHHDKGYLDFIDRAVREGAIRPVAADTNLYYVIAQAAMVVVIPYSSPAYVAAQLGVPAIYYDPANELVPTHEHHPCVRFIAGPKALQDTLVGLARSSCQRPVAH